MKKNYIAILFLVMVTVLLWALSKSLLSQNFSSAVNQSVIQEDKKTQPTINLANPASINCQKKGGTIELITNRDGSQFGMCKIDDYSCEEWVLYNGECTIEEDSRKIKQELVSKGLNLSDMKIVIYKHLGKYIEGGVVPVSSLGGGGYVFAIKENGQIKILADGNGAIMCASFQDYSDFPSYLVQNCIDENGDIVDR